MPLKRQLPCIFITRSLFLFLKFSRILIYPLTELYNPTFTGSYQLNQIQIWMKIKKGVFQTKSHLLIDFGSAMQKDWELRRYIGYKIACVLLSWVLPLLLPLQLPLAYLFIELHQLMQASVCHLNIIDVMVREHTWITGLIYYRLASLLVKRPWSLINGN